MNARNTITINGATHELSEEFLSQVLNTAVEGACSYWADVSAESADNEADRDSARDFDVSDYVEEDAEPDVDSDRISYTSASFLVSKDPAQQGGTLDLQGIADAIERIASGEVEIPPAIREIIIDAVENEDASDIDAEAADCIVQVGLFDEVVYG